MAALTPKMEAVLATIREAGVCRIAVRKTQRRPGSHGQWRMARPQLSDEPTSYRAECGGRACRSGPSSLCFAAASSSRCAEAGACVSGCGCGI